MYRFLADVIVAIHVSYVTFVVGGLLIIPIGIWRSWRWVRNPWFRYLHLTAILLVVVESLAGIPCPLTVWENQLREAAGQSIEDASFLGQLLHRLIFFRFPEWVFTISYVVFACLIMMTLWLWPPRRRSVRSSQ